MSATPDRRSQPSTVIKALLRLAATVARSARLQAIHDAALDAVRDALGIHRSAILLFDDDGVMRFHAWRDLPAEYRGALEGHAPWQRGEVPPPMLVADIARDASLAPLEPVFAREGIAAVAFVPLLGNRRVIGTLALHHSRAHAWTPYEVEVALAVAHQVGFAVERTRHVRQGAAGRRLLFALEAAQMGTWEWNLVSNEVQWSENLERIHGLPPGTFTGDFSSYEREIHPDDRPRVLASLRRALAEGAIHDVEYRIVAPDGTIRWVHGKGRVERDASGRPLSMSGVCMDIGVRKRAELAREAALREQSLVRDRLTELTSGSQALLSSLSAESVHAQVLALAARVVAADAYAVWRRSGHEWRVAASRGLSPAFAAATIAHRPRFDVADPVVVPDVELAQPFADRQQAYAAEGIRAFVTIPLVVRGHSAASIALYYRAPHEPSDVELRVTVALGHLAAAAVTAAEAYEAQDAQRGRAEEAAGRAALLAEASSVLASLDYESNLRTLARLIVPRLADWCAVDLVDADGGIRRVAVAHRDPDQAHLAWELHDRYPPAADDRGVGGVVRTGRPELLADVPDSQLAALARDEEHLRLLWALDLRSAIVVPLTASRHPIGALTLARTAASRRYADADVQFATELARRAAYAVENARLFRTVREANRLKDEFLASLSHELRTPLNVMVGRAQMLEGVIGDPQAVRAAAAAIGRNGATLTRLVEDLLDVSRITMGRLKLEPAPLRLHDVLDAAVQAVLPTARAKGVQLQAVSDPLVPPVVGDATRLQQVFWNLLSNAVKFTQAGGRVTVTLGFDGGQVVLTVADTGDGIEPAFLPHVFDMFRQAEPPAQRTQGGLGLGLSIVRQLVELHGGTVAAASPGRGAGATFSVRLPAAPAAEMGAGAGGQLPRV